MCLEHHKLDPAYFYTATGLAWQALLNTVSENCEHEAKCKDCELCLAEFRLELRRDIHMILMFEKDVWGRITQAVKRYATANNKHMRDQYNPDEKSTYGWVMIQKLPVQGFSLEKVEEFTPDKIDKLAKIYVEYVEHPKELHKNHNELSFLSDRLKMEKM